jgi:SNF2 family DNA or RNA helicase
MLSPRAVRAFKARPRKDFSKWKALSNERLEQIKADLPVTAPVWSKLKKLQKVCFLIGAKRKRFAFLNDTGTGKTYLSIALMRYFLRLQLASRNLVLVPNKINKREWAEEGFEKHSPRTKYIVLKGSSANKWKQIEDNPDAEVFIETYAGFVRMVCDRKTIKRKGKKDRSGLIPNKKKVLMLAHFFEGVYCDESTYLKNKKRLPYRITNKLSQFAEVFFILTATPFGRDVEDIWAQMYLVDRGETLGETLTLFREAFFEKKKNYWGGQDYKLTKQGKAEISRFLDHGSITYPAEQSDLPHMTRYKKVAYLGTDAETYYERAKTQIMTSHGNFLETKNAFLRMRQISSGFVGYTDDETGDRASYVFPQNPKLELLESIVQRFPERYKFIIYHEFNYSAGVISAMLKKNGIKHVLINGMMKDTDPSRDAFKKDPSVRGLVLSNSAGGYGLNLQNARYGVYYESPVGAILRKQTEKRFDRQYSLHKNVFLYDCVVSGTVDESILQFHKEGRSLWKAILNTGAGVLNMRPQRRKA